MPPKLPAGLPELGRQILRQAETTLRQRERELEEVIEVLRPGPLGAVAQRFSREELFQADADVARASLTWQQCHAGGGGAGPS